MRPAELFAIAASAARAKPVPTPASGDADAFSRSLDSQLRQTPSDEGPRGTTGAVGQAAAASDAASANPPVRDGIGPGRFGVEQHLVQAENRAARVEWRAFLQDLRGAGILGGSRGEAIAALSEAAGKGDPTALVADPTTSAPKPGPQAETPFGQALDALGAAIQAAIADPAANPAEPGQLPVAVQSALDAAAALAPPALQARMQAITARLADGLAAAMAGTSGETPTTVARTEGAETERAVRGFDSPVAQAIMAAVSGAGEAVDLSVLRVLQDKGAAARAEAAASAPAASTSTADAAPAAAPAVTAKTADATPAAQTSGGETAAPDPVAAQAARTAAADVTPGRAELTSQTTPAASAPAAEAHAAVLVATRGAPELVAQMAAVISRKLEGRVTRFNMELNPAEMGRVDVRLNIEKDGRVAAQLSFDNPVAAADMRGKADELRRQLELSGFNVASEDLTFSDRESGQGFRRNDQALADPDISRARAFREADRNARLAEDAGRLSARATLGLDMRV
jgi:flagellar hook-length control protein FliK